MNVAVIPNQDKPDALAAAGELVTMLRGHVGTVATLMNPSHSEMLKFSPDLVVVLGGDGSILGTAQALAGIRAPVVGINFGKLGYLAAFSLEQFRTHLGPILDGKVRITDRLMLLATIYKKNGADKKCVARNLSELMATEPVSQAYALNDVVINAGEPFHMIELHVQINEHETTTFRSDGLIVSTASGSTGYNLSAGGPLIVPEVPAMVLTPICPHSLSFRPVVMSQNSCVLVCPHKLNAGTRVNFDGQITQPLLEEHCLLIRKADVPLRLVENPETSHWQMLGQKLHWAQSPRVS